MTPEPILLNTYGKEQNVIILIKRTHKTLFGVKVILATSVSSPMIKIVIVSNRVWTWTYTKLMFPNIANIIEYWPPHSQ